MSFATFPRVSDPQIIRLAAEGPEAFWMASAAGAAVVGVMPGLDSPGDIDMPGDMVVFGDVDELNVMDVMGAG